MIRLWPRPHRPAGAGMPDRATAATDATLRRPYGTHDREPTRQHVRSPEGSDRRWGMRTLGCAVAWAIMSAIAVAPPACGLVDYRVWVPTLIAMFAISAARD